MKTSKKFIAIVCAVLMLASLASCGSAGGYNKPIVCGETSMNDICGVATYGVDYYNLGVKAGDMAAEILLDGADPATMAVGSDPAPALSINETAAAELNFTVPESVKAKAGTAESERLAREDSAIVESGADFTVGILQLVQHDALDNSNKGFVDELSIRMKEAGKTVTILDRNASGDQSNNITISDTFVSQKVDLIYAIATSSAQAAANATVESGIPVIFNAVTNPVDAGLVASFEAPGANVTGVSDINPVADQIDLISELLGREDITIGLLYTSAESNSQYQIELAKAECDKRGFKYVVKGIGDLNDIESAFIALKDTDAIYIPTDNVLANGAATIHSTNMGK